MELPHFGQITGLGSQSYQLHEVDLDCPHCGRQGVVAQGPMLEGRTFVGRCRRCNRHIMVFYGNGPSHPPTDYFPKQVVTVDPRVPSSIAEDYLEAQRCFLVAAYRGCAVMARRCMHSLVAHKGATGDDLYKSIKQLKDANVLTPSLADLANHIRVFGKYGAHPSDDGLVDVTMQDAQAALQFCDYIIKHVILLEEDIKASRASQEYPRPPKTS